MRPIGFSDHDHAACVRSTMQVAEAQCAERGLRLITPEESDERFDDMLDQMGYAE